MKPVRKEIKMSKNKEPPKSELLEIKSTEVNHEKVFNELVDYLYAKMIEARYEGHRFIVIYEIRKKGKKNE